MNNPFPHIDLRPIVFALLITSICAPALSEEPEPGHRHDDPIQRFKIEREPDVDLEALDREAMLVPGRLARPVRALRRSDPDAELSFFRGYLDSFSTSPKPAVPDYARKILKRFELGGADSAPTPMVTETGPRKERDWDANPDIKLPYEPEPGLAATRRDALQSNEDAARKSEQPDSPPPEGRDPGKQIVENRTEENPLLAAELSNWQPPTESFVAHESEAAKPVLAGFLREYRALFEVPGALLDKNLPNLEQVDFNHGKFAKRATFQQYIDGLPVQSGKTVVLFDHNWNVIHLSRLVVTPDKYKQLSMRQRDADPVPERRLRARALELTADASGLSPRELAVEEATRGFDMVRGLDSWVVRVVGGRKELVDVSLTFDALGGELLNASDNVDRHTDVKVNRWGFSAGDYQSPSRYVSTGFYTRDDRTMVHDFFHLVTDNRNDGSPLDECSATPQVTDTVTAAYGTNSGSNYIRPTRRSDRDFSLWWPSESSGTFGEAHTYYWARWYMQWQKPALRDYGVLPSSAANYPRALVIKNSCNSGVGVHNNSGFMVTVYNNVGEGINTIRLPERCRSSNPNCNSSHYASSNTGQAYIFSENAGYSSPGVIHHELNHFVMWRYLGVGSQLDCDAGTELKFLHEGALGRSLPQAYWHTRYGVGYAPTVTSRQYRASEVSGRSHTSNSNLNKRSDYPCVSDASAYNAGSVVHQAMYKFYHGVTVNGSIQSSIPRFSTNRDFVLAYYWAADLTSGATLKTRRRFARELMWIMNNHSNLSSSGRQQWCDVWKVHELGGSIPSSYCN